MTPTEIAIVCMIAVAFCGYALALAWGYFQTQGPAGALIGDEPRRGPPRWA